MLIYEQANEAFIRMMKQGRFAEASLNVPQITEALPLQKASNRVVLLNNLGDLYFERGLYMEAKRHYFLAEEAFAEGLISDSVRMAVIGNKARLFRYLGDYKMAFDLCNTALELDVSDGYIRGSILMHLAGLHRTFGNYTAAYTTLLSAKEQIESSEMKSEVYSKFLRRLGTLYRSQGVYVDAERAFLEAFRENERYFRLNHPEHGKLLSCLAELYRSRGETERSRPLYAESFWIIRRAYGYNHPETAMHIGNVGELVRAQGRNDRAEKLYIRCVNTLENTLGNEHPEYAKRLINLAQLYRYTGRFLEAKELLAKALIVLEGFYGKDHHHVAKLNNNLSGILLSLGQLDEAETICRHALKVRLTKLGNRHHHVARSYMTLHDIALARNDFVTAQSACQEALRIFNEALGAEHRSTIQAAGKLRFLIDRSSSMEG